MANTARVTQSAVFAIGAKVGVGLASVTQSVVIAIVGLGIVCDSPPAGDVGTPYSHTFPAGSGQLPYAFSITAGALPTDLTLNAATGQVTGTPIQPGVFIFTITVTDALTTQASVQCSISITGGFEATITLYGYKLFPKGGPCEQVDTNLVESEAVPPVKRVL
jgi:hypothetical protein